MKVRTAALLQFLGPLHNAQRHFTTFFGCKSRSRLDNIVTTPIKFRSCSSVGTKAQSSILLGREDRYNGIIVDPDQLPSDPSIFSDHLRDSLKHWAAKGKRGIWLELRLSQSGLITAAVDAGFDFKHAQKGHVVLTKWLASDVPDLLPEGASHQVGVGAFVLNERREMLLVQEKLGSQYNQALWKLPTGLVTVGEDIPQAAAREVLEETGIRATFDAVLAVRQSHGYLFGRSDLFFVCAMRLGEGEQTIQLQQTELAAAGWHDLQTAGSLPIFQSGPMFKGIFRCCKAYAAGTYGGMTAQKLANGFNPKMDMLMHGLDSASESQTS